MPMVMPGFNTRSAADVAHQYAAEQLQQQEIDLRAQAQQVQQQQAAQQLFQRQQEFELRQLEQKRLLESQEQQLALGGTKAAVELGMKYDAATKGYRPLEAADPEFNTWKERQAERSSLHKARLAEMEAATPEARLGFLGQSLALREPYEIAGETRAEKRAMAGEERAVARANKAYENQVEKEKLARREEFAYNVREATLKHALDMVKLQETMKAKGEKGEDSALYRDAKAAQTEVHQSFNQWQEALNNYETNKKRILDEMEASSRQATKAKSRWYWFDAPPPSREEIAGSPQFRETMQPFEQQIAIAKQMRDAATLRYDMVLKRGAEQAAAPAGQPLEAGGPTLEQLGAAGKKAEAGKLGQSSFGQGRTALGAPAAKPTFSYESVMDAWPQALTQDMPKVAALAAYIWKNPRRTDPQYLLQTDKGFVELMGQLTPEGRKQWQAILQQAGVAAEERGKAARLGV